MRSADLTFGDYLRSIRTIKGLTIRRAARTARLEPSHVSKIERNASLPQPPTLLKLATVYGCPWWNDAENLVWLEMVISALNETTILASSEDIRKTRHLLSTAQNISDALDALDSTYSIWKNFYEWTRMPQELPGMQSAHAIETTPWWAWVLASVRTDEPPGGVYLPSIECPESDNDLIAAAMDLASAFMQEREQEESASTDRTEDEGQALISRLAKNDKSMNLADVDSLVTEIRVRLLRGDQYLTDGIRSLLVLKPSAVEAFVAFVASTTYPHSD